MPKILRNLARRKLRSTLTISGIVIGIFALTAMGSMAEHFNSMLDLGVRYSSAAINVGPPDGQQAGLLPLSDMDQLKNVEGVRAVFPAYHVNATVSDTINFGAPDVIMNQNPGEAAYSPLSGNGRSAGSDLTGDGQVVLGAAMANQYKKSVGDTIYLPVRPQQSSPTFVNHPFRVVGLLNRTGNFVDNTATVTTTDARMLYRDSLPPALRNAVDVSQFAPQFTVYPDPGTSLSRMDAIAAQINQQVPSVKAAKPSVAVNNFKSTGTTFTAITSGAALLALVIGGLSVANTMLMAVTERTREIGLKKALGAHTRHIVREVVFESAVIGLIGGLAGYLLASGLTNLLDTMGRASNMDLFLVTPKLTLIALSFAVGLGAVAGLVPALRAARLDPVTALRSSN